jgi:hypothetical protein
MGSLNHNNTVSGTTKPITMLLSKNVCLSFLMLLTATALRAQKVDYKSGSLSVDGKEIAKVVKIKDKASFGLTGTYELYSLSGEKLIIATIATDFVPNRKDNTGAYYRFTFLTTNQVGIFSLSSFGPEKSFAKLIGENKIIVDDHLDPKMVAEMIALKGNNPEVSVEYHLVQRDFSGPVFLKDALVVQGNTTVGKLKDVSTQPELSTYEFSIPDGLVVAKVSFKGGNAKDFLITTYKDKLTRNYTIDIDSQFKDVIVISGDKNEPSLKRAAKWLVKNGYL